MGFDREPARNFGRASKAPLSRQELILQLQTDREARTREKRLVAAVVKVQSCYRGWHVRRQVWARVHQEWLTCWGQTAASSSSGIPAAVLADQVLAPVLFLYKPSPALSQSSQPLSLQHRNSSSSIPSAAKSSSERRAPLRGALAIMLRSLAAQLVEHDWTSLCTDAARRADWEQQAVRLARLCCAILQAFPGRQQAGAGAVQSPALACLTCQSAARLLQQLLQPSSRPASWSGHAGASEAAKLVAARLESGPDPYSAAAAVALQASRASSFQGDDDARRLRIAAVAGFQAMMAPLTHSTSDQPSAAAEGMCRYFLSCPTVQHLASEQRAQLQTQPIYSHLLKAAAGLVEASRGMGAQQLGWLAGSLLQLLCGSLGTVENQAGHKLQGTANAQPLYVCPLLSSQQTGPDIVPAALGGITSLLSAASQQLQAGGMTDSPTELAAALWPLGDPVVLAQLLRSAAEGGTEKRDAVLTQLVLLYHAALELLPVLNPSADTGMLLNALAFSPSFLAATWPCLARSLGLPLQIPRGASRGWDVPSLKGGMPALQPVHSAMAGTFCWAAHRCLLALDDDEFHATLPSLGPDSWRAVAAVMTSLVARTHLSSASGSLGAGALQQAGSMPCPGGASRMLQAQAPALLRQLHDRDLRRQFCPPELWLDAWHHRPASTPAPDAPAVVNALQQGPAARAGCKAGTPAALASLLLEAPQVVPFADRVSLVRALIAADKARQTGPPTEVVIRRQHLLEDAQAALGRMGPDIKCPLKVVFLNQQGMLEAGIDQGGLLKEFIEEAIQTGFDARLGLMTSTSEGLAYPQPKAGAIPGGHALLSTLGLILGKALFEGLLVDLPLAPFFVARLQGRHPCLDDLGTLDGDLHRSILQIKRYEGDVEDLGLDFTVDDETFGQVRSQELRPGGASLAVTNANRLQYCYLLAHWHLHGRLGASAAAFASGLAQVVPPAWLRLFSTQEVAQLLSGGEAGAVSVQDLRQHAAYSGGFTARSSTVVAFWKVVEGFDAKQLAALLKFVTSCSRPPLGGFQFLVPPFTIHLVPCEASPFALLGGKDVERLATASTCFNTLKLPNYRRGPTLRSKLLYAIQAGAGFELS